jgi:RNA polymerase sigma-70 factor (ECF subfamily)
VDYSSLDDATLIDLIARARTEALGELYDRYSRLVYSLAVNTVGDYGTAEEITQDVFVRVWQRAASYQAERAKVSTWLTSIARHRAIDQLRRRGARPEQHTVSWAEAEPDSLTANGNPQEAAQLAMDRDKVRSALAQLPEEQRQVLALAYFQGYTQQQIADALDQPLGTVKTRVRLAMQKLRQLLDVQGLADR